MPLTAAESKIILAKLAELGGRANKDEDILYEGNKLVIPEKMSLKQADQFLQKKIKELEEVSNFTRVYPYRPWDGAFNAYQAMRKVFGIVSGYTIPGGFFSPDQPPSYIQVQVNPHDTVEVPWGAFKVGLLENSTIHFGAIIHKEWGHVFQIIIEAPRKYAKEIEGLFKAIEVELSENSIYRGKAFDGQAQPQFIDTSLVDPSRIVYAEEVLEELEANLWNVIRDSQTQVDFNLSLKRTILMEGRYGVGKTLALLMTAQIAAQHGWGTIMVRPGRDDLLEALQTAKLYQPCVVEFEDIDTITGGMDEADMVSKVLDAFDGIQAKGTKIILVLTTNHADKIHKAMQRPGRIDSTIKLGLLDAAGVKRLIQLSTDAQLEEDIDWAEVTVACEEYIPAFIAEVATRAVRYVLVRVANDKAKVVIGTADLIKAANALRPQFERMQEAPELVEKDYLKAGMEGVVRVGAERAVAGVASQTPNSQVWNPTTLLPLQNGSKH